MIYHKKACSPEQAFCINWLSAYRKQEKRPIGLFSCFLYKITDNDSSFCQATKGPKMPLFSSRRLQNTAILYRCVHWSSELKVWCVRCSTIAASLQNGYRCDENPKRSVPYWPLQMALYIRASRKSLARSIKSETTVWAQRVWFATDRHIDF